MSSLVTFGFLSHPVSCCFVVLVRSLCLRVFVYLFVGFRWYLVLFCLVYVGGVYILFVYASLYCPNLFIGLGYRMILFFLCLGLFRVCFCAGFNSGACFIERRHYLCGGEDGFSYRFFCLIMFLGFVLVRFVSSRKDSYIR